MSTTTTTKPTAACPCCNASGTVNKAVTCTTCRGTGRAKCRHCQGAGKRTRNNGTVQVLCFTCDGSGIFTKASCNKCKGSRVVNVGNHRCEKCKGSGRIAINMVIIYWPLVADKRANAEVAEDLAYTVEV